MKFNSLFLTVFTSFGLMTSGFAATHHQANSIVCGNPHPQLTASSSQPIHLNSIDAKALTHSVKGVSASRAKAIVAYREAHGRFKTIDDLSHVHGITPSILKRYRALWQKSFTMG